MWTRSPRARLAMRIFGPFLMHLCALIILSKVTFPMIPNRKTKHDTNVLIYLKTSFILVGPLHMGSGAGRFGPLSCGLELFGAFRWFSVMFWGGEAAVKESSDRTWAKRIILKDANIRNIVAFSMTSP